MDHRKVLAFQFDNDLCTRFLAFHANSEKQLGREVTESEAVRVLIRRALDSKLSLNDAGYIEGYRAGMAEAKRAFAEGVASATAKTLTGANAASKSAH